LLNFSKCNAANCLKQALQISPLCVPFFTFDVLPVFSPFNSSSERGGGREKKGERENRKKTKHDTATRVFSPSFLFFCFRLFLLINSMEAVIRAREQMARKLASHIATFLEKDQQHLTPHALFVRFVTHASQRILRAQITAHDIALALVRACYPDDEHQLFVCNTLRTQPLAIAQRRPTSVHALLDAHAISLHSCCCCFDDTLVHYHLKASDTQSEWHQLATAHIDFSLW
jgi:hypothetical protein